MQALRKASGGDLCVYRMQGGVLFSDSCLTWSHHSHPLLVLLFLFSVSVAYTQFDKTQKGGGLTRPNVRTRLTITGRLHITPNNPCDPMKKVCLIAGG